MLNDIADLQNFAGDLAYYEQMQQYLSILDMKLNGTPQVQWSRHQDRLYIFGDFADKDILEGEYVVAEVYTILDPETHTSIYNDMWLKRYATALVKYQWGTNLSKFGGMQLPGGVELNGAEIMSQAQEEIQRLEEESRLNYELPPLDIIG